jgi:predicted branched-subunit amino acid permease
MYSAVLSPHFVEAKSPTKAAASYLLTDQAFAVSVVRYGRRGDDPYDQKLAYYFGAALALWVTWQISTVVGVVIGTGVPAEWSLDFAIPLVFIALVFPAVTDRSTAAAAVVGAVVAVVAFGMAYNLGLPTAAAIGVIVGMVVEGRS